MLRTPGLVVLLALALSTACSSSEPSESPDAAAPIDASVPDPKDAGPDAGLAQPDAAVDAGLDAGVIDTSVTSTCGEKLDQPGAECDGIADCGAATNLRTVSFCDHCLQFAETHVCESGTCRAMDRTGEVEIAFSVPLAAVGAQSFTLAVLNPLTADGVTLTCDALLSTCPLESNPQLNVSSSGFRNVLPPGVEMGIVYTITTDADVGADRVVLVRVTSSIQGQGNIVAVGCAEGVDVASGQTSVLQLAVE